MLPLRALAALLVLPGVVAGLIPACIAARSQIHRSLWPSGAGLLLVGAALLLWCVRDFCVSGRGTLAPWDPPRRLVVVGLYRWVRNPMYLAVLVVVAGWAALFGSVALLLYLLVLCAGFHLRVVFYEEPWLRRQFGADWDAYAAGVPRWLPRGRRRDIAGGA